MRDREEHVGNMIREMNATVDGNLVAGWYAYVQRHRRQALFFIVLVLFVYGIVLFRGTIGVDTEEYMAVQRFINWKRIGRFGLVFLQKIFWIDQFNPYASYFVGLLFLWLSATIWCYFLEVVAGKPLPEYASWLFGSFYLANAAFVDQMYYSMQCAETSFILCLSPFAVLWFCRSLLAKRWHRFLLSCLLFVFLISVYQGIVMMLVGGILIFFLFIREWKPMDVRQEWSFAILAILGLVASLLCYSVLNLLIQKWVFHLSPTNFLSNRVGREEENPLKGFIRYTYMLEFGSSKLASSLFDPFIAAHSATGWNSVATIHRDLYGMANWIYAPMVLLFWMLAFQKQNRKSAVWVLATICLPLTVLAFPLVARETVRNRVQSVVPLVMGAIAVWLLVHTSRHWSILLAVIGFSNAWVMAQQNAVLLYSNQRQYQAETAFVREVDADIKNTVKDDVHAKPLLIAGKKEYEFDQNFIRLRSSIFRSQNPYETSSRGTAFMRIHGLPYHGIDVQLIHPADMDRYVSILDSMPAYPNKGYIRELPDCILVKLEDGPYCPAPIFL